MPPGRLLGDSMRLDTGKTPLSQLVTGILKERTQTKGRRAAPGCFIKLRSLATGNASA